MFWDDIEVIPAGITLVGIVLGFYFFGDVAMIATIATKDLTKFMMVRKHPRNGWLYRLTHPKATYSGT